MDCVDKNLYISISIYPSQGLWVRSWRWVEERARGAQSCTDLDSRSGGAMVAAVWLCCVGQLHMARRCQPACRGLRQHR
jgi:hypothetical protein